jgi:hypothetical protein
MMPCAAGFCGVAILGHRYLCENSASATIITGKRKIVNVSDLTPGSTATPLPVDSKSPKFLNLGTPNRMSFAFALTVAVPVQ